MARTKAQKKGDALEDAVRMIEALILGTSPATKDAVVTIEPKKIVVVEGVKHEIDLYITIKHARGYESVYIFECKNWQAKVDKNELIVFSQKIQDVGAQTGYYIAKRFTKDAEAQAKRDRRIQLLTASTELDNLPPLITTHHMLHKLSSRTDLSLRVVTSDPKQLEGHTNTNEIRIRLRNKELSYQEFAQRIHDIVYEGVMNHEPTGTFSAGTYHYERTQTFPFSPQDLFVDDLECRELDAHVTWEVEILRPKIVSAFDIKTRGRVATQEFTKLPPGLDTFKVAFIHND